MWEHRRLLITGGVAVGLLLVAATATLGVLVGRAVNDELRADLDAAIQAQRLLGGKDATIAQLEGRITDLDAEIEGVRADRDVARRDLVLKAGELAQLTQLIAGGENTSVQLTELESSYEALEGDYAELRSEHDALVARFADFVPIETAELSTDALYLDRSVREVAVTRPLCTGSMEPTITCDDLLILYEPASATDLDEGDVIYFRKPTTDYSGYLEGRFTLHRISNVISNAEGIWFQTKGDAFVNPDRCLVPADAVQFKLLTTVHNARFEG